MQKYEHLTIRAIFRAGGTTTVNFINDEAVGGKQIAFYPYLQKLGDEGWAVVSFYNDIFVLKRLKA